MFSFNLTSSRKQSPYTLLVDYCKRTSNLEGYDDYEEIALYQNTQDQSYIFHAYKKAGKMLDEVDVAFASNQDEYKVITDKIKELKLAEYKDQKGDSQSEIKYSLKYKTDDGYIKITNDNLNNDNLKILCEVGDLMYHLTK